MRLTLWRCILVASFLTSGTAMAQRTGPETGVETGNKTTTGDLAGVSEPGLPGGAHTAPTRNGPETGASTGNKTTTGDLAGVGRNPLARP